jgi:hypothetical protein
MPTRMVHMVIDAVEPVRPGRFWAAGARVGDDGRRGGERAAGAVPADIGQGDAPWDVMADPQGHEFCLLTPR